jgi:cytochrome c oxidase cbb3-type subunit 3
VKIGLGILAAIVLITSACGGDSSQTSPSPTDKPVAPQTASPASTAPAGNLRGDAAAGAQLYATYCASCHGPNGKGDGPVAAALKPPPANHADHVYMGSLSDEHLYQVISQGGASVGKSALMAPWSGVVNDQGIRDLIAFIRKLSST